VLSYLPRAVRQASSALKKSSVARTRAWAVCNGLRRARTTQTPWRELRGAPGRGVLCSQWFTMSTSRVAYRAPDDAAVPWRNRRGHATAAARPETTSKQTGSALPEDLERRSLAHGSYPAVRDYL